MSTSNINEIVEVNAQLAAESFCRRLEAMGGPTLDEAAKQLLASSFKVHLVATMAELGFEGIAKH